jgi:hypothetical protein
VRRGLIVSAIVLVEDVWDCFRRDRRRFRMILVPVHAPWVQCRNVDSMSCFVVSILKIVSIGRAS